MTPPQKRAILTGVLTFLIGASLIAAADQVILRPEFSLHEANVNSSMQRILDVVCTDHPTHRSC